MDYYQEVFRRRQETTQAGAVKVTVRRVPENITYKEVTQGVFERFDPNTTLPLSVILTYVRVQKGRNRVLSFLDFRI